MSRLLAVIVTTSVVTLAAAAPSWAQEPAVASTRTPSVDPLGTSAPPAAVALGDVPTRKQYRSPTFARDLSLAGTGVGLGTIALGALTRNVGMMLVGMPVLGFGPSLGHFYSGRILFPLLRSAFRTGAVFLWGLSQVSEYSSVTDPIAAGTGLVIGVLTLIDIVGASRAAKRANVAHARRMGIMPTPVVGPDRSTGMGMSLMGRF